MKASDLLVKCLEQEGVRFVFGIPGEENLDLLDSLRQSKQIKLILTRHEQAAGFMAATYGRLTGQAGVCLATLGPGATNLVTAGAYANLGAMPMVMITGQKPILKSKQARFQIIDVVEMMRPITKFSKQVVSARTVPVVVREAFNISEAERPGATHIELPEDVAALETDTEPFPISRARRPSADEKAVRQAVAMIEEAKSPLVLLGAATNRNRISNSLQKFLGASRIPFFNTQMGKGVVDERQETFLGTAALSEEDYLHFAVQRSDLIINVGHDVVEKPPFFMEPGGARVIHINNFPAQVDEVYFPQLEVVGDIANTLNQITFRLDPSPKWDFSYFARVKAVVESHTHECSDDDRFPVIPQRIVSEVRKALPEDGILTLDNGMYKIWFARNYRAYLPNTILLDNALASMGAGLPSAIAASLVHPDLKVITVCGDGGFMMNSQELETAVRLGLNLTVLILLDNAYGMIKWKQTAVGFEDFGLDYNNPDFVAYAKSYGAHGHRVEKTEDLGPTLERCVSTPGVHVVELPVDYSENTRVLIDELKQKVPVA